MKKRTQRSRTERAKIVEAWHSSGESRKDYSKKIGVQYPTFCSWVSEYTKDIAKPISGLSGKSNEVERKPKRPSFLPVDIQADIEKTMLMEICLPNGVVIRSQSILPVDYLQTLLQSC